MAWFGTLQGFTRRKSITIYNPVVDYQMKAIVHQSGGSDTATDIYLGHARDDFADIRFTGPDGSTPLNYWIESITGTSPNLIATVWIKIPLLTPVNSIYIYYDNPIATTTSNGDNTFLFFQDFTSGDGGLTRNTGSSATLIASGGTLNTGGSSANMDGFSWPTPSLSVPVIEEIKVKRTSNNINNVVAIWRPNSGTFFRGIRWYGGGGGNARVEWISDGGGVDFSFNQDQTTNQWYKYKIEFISQDSVKIYVDDILKVTGNPSNVFTSVTIGLGVDNGWTGSFDNIFVRKYTSSEPSFSSINTEELNISATAMALDKTSCLGPCSINAYVTWHNYGNNDIASFTPKIIIDSIDSAVGAPISILTGGETSSGAVTTPVLSVGTHTICPSPN